MLRWFLLHGFVLILYMVLAIVFKLVKTKSIDRYVSAGIAIPVELAALFACILGSSLIASAVIEKNVDAAKWIMAIGQVLALLAPVLAASAIARALQLEKIPGFVYVIIGIGIVGMLILQMKSFDLAYGIMEQWDVMGEEQYFDTTQAMNLVDLAQLLLSIVPTAVFIAYSIAAGLKKEK